jgi:hypothetical protein
MHTAETFKLTFGAWRFPSSMATASVLGLLGIDKSDPRVSEVWSDDEAPAVVITFADGGGFHSDPEHQLWAVPEFREATAWLRERQPEQTLLLSKVGASCEVRVRNYNGPLPGVFLSEVLRLGITLVVDSPSLGWGVRR